MPQVCSKGADYEGYSAAITRCSFGGDVIDALDINDVTQLMESMGISTHHRLVLKATFTGWKKSPGAAFEALASAKVAHAQHMAPLLFDVCFLSTHPLKTTAQELLHALPNKLRSMSIVELKCLAASQ